MSVEVMMFLARNYLTNVNELPKKPMSVGQFLQYTVDVYNKRKEQGLEQ